MTYHQQRKYTLEILCVILFPFVLNLCKWEAHEYVLAMDSFSSKTYVLVLESFIFFLAAKITDYNYQEEKPVSLCEQGQVIHT